MTSDWTLRTVLVLVGILSAACGEDTCKGGDKCGGCWDCEARADGRQPGQITGEELAQAVVGTWKGRYMGDRYGQPVDVRITLEPVDDGDTTYGAVRTLQTGCDLPADVDARCARVETKAARITVVTQPAEYGFDGEWLSVGGLTLREEGMTTKEAKTGSTPDGIPYFKHESSPRDPAPRFALSSDDTLWMAPDIEDVGDYQPYEKIGSRLAE